MIKSPHVFVFIMFALATLIGFLLDLIGVQEANLIMVYILAVIIIAIYTHSYRVMIYSPFVVVALFNFFFTEPRYTFSTEDNQYPFTFAMMFLITIISTSMTIRFKNQIELNELLVEEKQAIQLRAHTEQLKATILKSISHDVRTPLMSISGTLETALINKKLSDSTRDTLLSGAYEDSLWMIRMIENILAVTKIQDERLTINADIESVDDIVVDVIRRFDKHRKNRHVLTEIPERVLMVRVDPNLIVQVLMNLLENAVKHAKEGGDIVLSVKAEADEVVFSVEDDGPGVSSLDLPHMFELFYTGHGDGSRGLGLGLAICKSILEAHDSQLTYSTSRFQGAKFTFKLALIEEAANE